MENIVPRSLSGIIIGERKVNSYAVGCGGYHMKFPLKSGRVKWFVKWLAKSVRRVPYERRAVFWEHVAAMRYAYVIVLHWQRL